MRSVDNGLGRVILHVPVHAHLVSAVESKLIPSSGIRQPPAQMLLLLEGLDVGWLVFLVDPSFTAIAVDIRQLVDGDCVFLVERDTVQMLHCSHGLLGSVIFNKSKSNNCKPKDDPVISQI